MKKRKFYIAVILTTTIGEIVKMIGIYSIVSDAKYKNTLVAPFETQEQVDAYLKKKAWEDLHGLGRMILSPEEVASIGPYREPAQPTPAQAPQPAAAMVAVEQPRKSEKLASTRAALGWLCDTAQLKALGITA